MKAHTPPVELRELYTFLLICNSGSMTEAAKQLQLTQSAISQSVRQLEQRLGAELFNRDSRPMSLTTEGEQILETVRSIVDQVNLLPELVRAGSRKPLRIIRLGLVDSFASTMGADVIKALESQAHRVVAWSGLSPLLSQSLSARQVDLIITTATMDNAEEFENTPLLHDPYLIAVPYQLQIPAQQDPLEWLAKNLPLIRYSARSAIGIHIEQFLRRRGIDAPYRYEFDATPPLLRMVTANLGWTITTPICMFNGPMAQEAFKLIPIPNSDFAREFYLSTRQKQFMHLPPIVKDIVPRIFMNYLFPEIQRAAPWLSKEHFHCK